MTEQEGRSAGSGSGRTRFSWKRRWNASQCVDCGGLSRGATEIISDRGAVRWLTVVRRRPSRALTILGESRLSVGIKDCSTNEESIKLSSAPESTKT